MGSSTSMHRRVPGSDPVQSLQRKPVGTDGTGPEISTSRGTRLTTAGEPKLSNAAEKTPSKQQPNQSKYPLSVDTSLQIGLEDDIQKMLKNAPHLKPEFEKIDNFKRDLKLDPTFQMLDNQGYATLMHLGFENEPDMDRKKLGDYMGIIDLADLIAASYEALLLGLCVDCMASLSADMVKDNEKTVLRCSLLRTIVWNNTDASLAFSEKVCKSGMLKHFVKDLKIMKVVDVVDACGDLDNVFESSISVLQNCSRNPATRQQLREYDTVKHLLPFLKCSSEEGKLQTLFTLANLVDESENKLLLADDSIFDTLFDILNEAWEDDEHRHLGFSAEELVDGMTGLAKNETNKKVLTKKGAVQILTEILQEGSGEEKEHALKCIWELAFDKENKHAMKEDGKLMTQLKQLKSYVNKAVRKTAERALWVIELEDKEHLASSKDGPVAGKQQRFKGHVMISYQWSDQKTLLKIRNSLRQKGFNVWMDVDDMGGSTLDAMAEAVQNAAVVLVCMSEKYKMSQNCRSEAEYAFSLEKSIVPLLMQRGYRPDGWLGMIKGTKLFFDFSGKYPYDQKVDDLTRELGNRGKHLVITDEPDGASAIVPVVQIPLHAAKGPSVAGWSEKDVQNWLTKSGLERNPSLQSLSGDNLAFLKDVSQRAPEFFFNYLKTDLHLLSLNDLMNFTRAIDKV